MRATRAIIHLNHLRQNIRAIRAHLNARGGGAVKICVSVKAEAYGHGMGEVARVALEEGVSALAVATVEEGQTLRAQAPDAEIILYGHPVVSELTEIVEANLSPFVAERDLIDALDAEADKQGRKLKVHLKVDTGMGRVGCVPEQAVEIARRISSCRSITLRGVATHFPAADGGEPIFTQAQVTTLKRVAEEIRGAGITFDLLHSANSGAVIDRPESWLDMVRPGIMLYGHYPSSLQERTLDLLPVMSVESRLSFVKRVPKNTPISYGLTYRTPGETVIGTVPLGYADGYFRLFSNKSDVLVFEGSADGINTEDVGTVDTATGAPRRVPVVGTVCMDQFMVDLGPQSRAVAGDRVVVFGADPRGPSAESLADLIGTISYELLTRLSPRVPRIYVDRQESRG